MNAEQFQWRFLPLQQQLYRQALALLGNEDDAEDAVQETYLRLWRQADRLGKMQNADGFFMQTLKNICLNIIRSHRHLAHLEPLANTVDEDDTVLREQLLAENCMWLRKAIGQLQPKARSMVTMFYFGKMSSKEIGEALGETDANVRSTLSRARSQLKKLLNDK